MKKTATSRRYCGVVLLMTTALLAAQDIPGPTTDQGTKPRQGEASPHMYRALLLLATDITLSDTISDIAQEYLDGLNPERNYAEFFAPDPHGRLAQACYELEQAAGYHDCHWQRDLGGFGPYTLLPEISYFASLGRFMLMRGDWQRDNTLASKDCLTVLALGRHLQCDTVLTCGLVGQNLEQRALLQLLSRSSSMSQEEKKACAQRLEQLAPTPKRARWTWSDQQTLAWFEQQVNATTPAALVASLHTLGLPDQVEFHPTQPELALLIQDAQNYWHHAELALLQNPLPALQMLETLNQQRSTTPYLQYLAPDLRHLVQQEYAVRSLGKYLVSTLREEPFPGPDSFERQGNTLSFTWKDADYHQQFPIPTEQFSPTQVTDF